MYARTTSGVAIMLTAAVGFVAPLAAQEHEHEGMHEGMTVSLASKNDSGVSGTATLREAEDAMGGPAPAVVLDLTGVEAGATYSVHVHKGTCATGGGVVTALTSVAAEGTTATATTVLTQEQIASLREAHGDMTDMAMQADDEEDEDEEAEEESSLFIQVHLPNGTPAACGDIPMMDDDEDGR